jgi:hypothetical protein
MRKYGVDVTLDGMTFVLKFRKIQGSPEVIGHLLIEFSYMLLIDNYFDYFDFRIPK